MWQSSLFTVDFAFRPILSDIDMNAMVRNSEAS